MKWLIALYALLGSIALAGFAYEVKEANNARIDEINMLRSEMVNMQADFDIKNRNQDMTITHLRLNMALIEVENQIKDGSMTMRDLSSLDEDVVNEFERRLKKGGFNVNRDGKVLTIAK